MDLYGNSLQDHLNAIAAERDRQTIANRWSRKWRELNRPDAEPTCCADEPAAAARAPARKQHPALGS